MYFSKELLIPKFEQPIFYPCIKLYHILVQHAFLSWSFLVPAKLQRGNNYSEAIYLSTSLGDTILENIVFVFCIVNVINVL